MYKTLETLHHGELHIHYLLKEIFGRIEYEYDEIVTNLILLNFRVIVAVFANGNFVNIQRLRSSKERPTTSCVISHALAKS